MFGVDVQVVAQSSAHFNERLQMPRDSEDFRIGCPVCPTISGVG